MPAEKKERNHQIIDRYVAGECCEEIAPDFDLSRERVAQIVRRAGVIRSQSEALRLSAQRGRFTPKKWAVKFPKGPDDPKREQQIAKLVSAGKSYQQTADEIGISRSAVAGAMHRYKSRRDLNASEAGR